MAQAASPLAAPRNDPLAIDRLVERVAAEVIAANAEAPIALYVRGESAELSRAFTTLLAAELGRKKLPAVPVDAPSASAAEVEARASGSRSLVRVSLSLENGLLQARGDLLGTWVNFWSGAAKTRPASPAAGLEASTDADAHALALAAVSLPTVPILGAPQTGELQFVSGVFARLPRHTAALASGDLDGDGKAEVLVLTDEEILAFSPEGKLLARREHRTLPGASSPCREPYGAISVLSGPPRISYVSGQRSRGEVLALEARGGFRVLGLNDEAIIATAGGAALTTKLSPGVTTLQATLTATGGAAVTLPKAPTTLSAFVGPNGAQLLAVFPDATASLRAGFAADAPSVELKGLGAASALVDVDGDGAPELVTTEAVYAPAPEILRVLRGPAVGALAESVRFRKEFVRGRALQLVGADLDGDRAEELIVAVWMPDGSTELQVYRRPK